MTKDTTMDHIPRKAWATPACATLDLASTAGGPPGGADAHMTNGNAGCAPGVSCS